MKDVFMKRVYVIDVLNLFPQYTMFNKDDLMITNLVVKMQNVCSEYLSLNHLVLISKLHWFGTIIVLLHFL